MSVGVTHAASVDVLCSFSLAWSVPSYGHTTSGSPVYGHLSCFQFSMMTEKAAVNIFYTSIAGESVRSFPLGVVLGVELLGQREGMCFAFVDIAKQFSKVIVPIYTQQSKVLSPVY